MVWDMIMLRVCLVLVVVLVVQSSPRLVDNLEQQEFLEPGEFQLAFKEQPYPSRHLLQQDTTGERSPNQLQFIEDENDASAGITYEVISGDQDTRIRITDTTAWPFRAIGEIGSGRRCTGTLVGPRHVLTAAHCIMDPNTGNFFRDLNFFPAQDNTDVPYGKFDWVHAVIPDGWYKQREDKFDYGLIIYLQRIDQVVGGVMSYDYQCDRSVFRTNIAGYPGDKYPYHTMWYTNCTGVEITCDDNKVEHECDTYSGMSGGPLFVTRRQGRELEHSIRAIHSGGNIVNGINRAVAVSQEVKSSLDFWIKETSI